MDNAKAHRAQTDHHYIPLNMNQNNIKPFGVCRHLVAIHSIRGLGSAERGSKVEATISPDFLVDYVNM